MVALHVTRIGALTSTIVFGVVAAAEPGPYSIRLTGVPEQLILPAPPGGNRVLTAVIKGGPVKSVWMSASTTSAARVELSRVDEGEYQLNLDGADVARVLDSVDPDEGFRIFAEAADGIIIESIPVRFACASGPRRLDFPWDRASVTICQRRSAELPGSRGQIRVRLGDITNAQVLLSIEGLNGQPLVSPRSVREGDAVSLRVGDEEYVLLVDRLVNLLIGEDYAVISLMSPSAWETETIERLLTLIGRSNLVFIRNGQDVSATEFADHLRQKWSAVARQVVKPDDFIQHIASRSLETGQPYQVRLEDSSLVELATWLWEQVRKMRSPSQPIPQDSVRPAPTP